VRGLNVLTVGDATAHAAREAGFKAVRSAAGDVEALGALTVETLDPAGGPIVHIAGTHVAGDLAGDLARAGFTYERRVAFDSIAATTLPEALAGAVDIVLFHSARAAETYAALGAFDASRRIAGCLSRNVAEAARLSPWKQIVVARATRRRTSHCMPWGQNSPAGASA
jgi:uroporphyrinogen-III synthase